MQVSKILLPIDGSKHSNNAIEYTIYLAKLTGAEVTAVCYYDWNGNMHEIVETVIDELKEKLQLQSQTILDEAGRKLQLGEVNFVTKSISGSPGSMLSKLAKSKEFDLIIMGSHGHSEIAGLLLGSVTHKVLNTIYCPVLVVP